MYTEYMLMLCNTVVYAYILTYGMIIIPVIS